MSSENDEDHLQHRRDNGRFIWGIIICGLLLGLYAVASTYNVVLDWWIYATLFLFILIIYKFNGWLGLY